MTGTAAHLDERRDSLTPEVVLDAAGEIIATEGLAALTMRRLATKLGVTTPTIYWHVGNKQALHERLLERYAEEVGEIRAVGPTPKQRIKSVVLGLRQEVTARPEVAELAQSLGVTGSIYAAANVALLAEIQAAGVAEEEVGPAMRSLLIYFASFFVFESQLANAAMEVDFKGLAEAGAKVPDLEPQVVAGLSQPVDFDETFDYTLDAIVESILWPGDDTAVKLRGIILAAVDTDAAAIESWNRWYDIEHLPPNIALPGIASGRRYVATPELVAARLPEEPLSGFEDGKGLHITIYLTDGDPVEAIGVMTERREDLEAAGRMDGAGNRVVRAGDAMQLSWAVSDPSLLLDEDDVAHIGHTAIRIVMRRGGDPLESRTVADAAVGQTGVHGVVSYSAQFQAGLECDIYLLEDSAVETISNLRAVAPYPADAQILLDAPFDLITPFDYRFAERIRASSLPQTID